MKPQRERPDPLYRIVEDLRRAGYVINGKTDAELREQALLATLDQIREADERKQCSPSEQAA